MMRLSRSAPTETKPMWQPMAFFNVFDVAAGGFGKVLPITRAGDVALPAGQILDDGLGVLQQHGEREVVGLLAV